MLALPVSPEPRQEHSEAVLASFPASAEQIWKEGPCRPEQPVQHSLERTQSPAQASVSDKHVSAGTGVPSA